jgi:pimeloyl-ACP methyl ester carboxylesterase
VDFLGARYQAYLAMKRRASALGRQDHLEWLRGLEAAHPPGSEGEGRLFDAALSSAPFDHDARRFASAEEEDLYRILSRRAAEPMRVADHWRWFVEADGLDRKDLSGDLPRLGVPVLVVGGSSDYVTPPATLEVIHRLVPGSRLVLMPGAGHHPYLLAPEAFVDHVARFAAKR